jgi:hypothetical protein
MNTKFSGRKPDGKYTNNLKEYVAAWNALIKPLEACGLVVTAFDPGLQGMVAGEQFSQPFSMPVSVAQKIVDALQRK